MSKPTWRNPGSAICRTVKIGADEPLPSNCPECGADTPRWTDLGTRVYWYPQKTWHRYKCPACQWLIIERAVPDESGTEKPTSELQLTKVRSNSERKSR